MSSEDYSKSVKDVLVALGRNKVELIRLEQSRTKHVYSLRVPNEAMALSRWRQTVNDFLLGTAEVLERKNKNSAKFTWQADVSKWFFAAGGSVKFCWRIMIVSNGPDGIERGENMFAQCATNALREGVEVTSMPLVGRKERVGQNLAGAYSLGDGHKKISNAIKGGVS